MQDPYRTRLWLLQCIGTGVTAALCLATAMKALKYIALNKFPQVSCRMIYYITTTNVVFMLS